MADYSQKAPGVYVEQVASGSAPIAGVGTSTAGFVGVVPDGQTMPDGETLAAVGDIRLVTNFTEFKNAFGDFSTDTNQSQLAHAVYGFFLNGGTRCWVTRIAEPESGDADIAGALELFEAVDEIAIVAAPGLSKAVQTTALVAHCAKMTTRIAILDTDEEFATDGTVDYATKLGSGGSALPSNSEQAALYFPWIQVQDSATSAPKYVPPSGHIAGIYARVDAQRGVHKAPANETILGALGVKYAISRSQQDGLNGHGVNCIRKMNGNIRVWGARTIGGSANGEFMYVNVRRLFDYVRGSIDQGMQWAVFEPNDAHLWAKITRNASAFLYNVWAAGALFGDKPELAFYVKCDAETNPPSLRDLGQVTTEIGIAIVRPAEFVVFKLGQKAAS